jgi:hypothetical protein
MEGVIGGRKLQRSEESMRTRGGQVPGPPLGQALARGGGRGVPTAVADLPAPVGMWLRDGHRPGRSRVRLWHSYIATPWVLRFRPAPVRDGLRNSLARQFSRQRDGED